MFENKSNTKQTLIKENLYGLDFLRAMAIILVLLFHNLVLFPHPEWINHVGEFGWIGVDLFFALSGFLIASQLFKKIVARHNLSIREFFIKRFFRIVPAYVVVLALYFCFPILRENPSLAPLWKYLTFTQNLGLDRNTQSAFSHAWSLCVEEQFYLFFPLSLIALRYFKSVSRGYILLISLFAFGFLARFYAWNELVSPFLNTEMLSTQWYKWMYYPTYARLDGLLFGILVAGLFHFKPNLKDRIQNYGNLTLSIGLIVLSIAYLICQEEKSFNFALFGFPLVDLGCGFLVLAAISPSSILYHFNSRFFSTVATLSYSIYLIHKITIHVTQEQIYNFGISKDSNTMLLLSTSTTILAAIFLNKCIEKPFMQLREILLNK
jgi:peptidoglycan/LPS O-acetylase OafA/YrhL